jgi:hypothetical protein
MDAVRVFVGRPNPEGRDESAKSAAARTLNRPRLPTAT